MSASSTSSLAQNSSSSPQNSAQTSSVSVNSINVNHGLSKEIVAQITGTCIMNRTRINYLCDGGAYEPSLTRQRSQKFAETSQIQNFNHIAAYHFSHVLEK